jgi:DNA-binding transcriptional ArsR family regulator
MSAPRFARVPPAAAMASRVHARALRVLIAICTSADPSGRAWPGVTEIARRTGLVRGKIPELVKSLESAGLIAVERRPGRDNLYTVNYEAELSPPTGTVSVPVQGDSDALEVSPSTGVPVQGDCPRPGVSPPTETTVPAHGYEVSPPTGTKHLKSSPEQRPHSLPLAPQTASLDLPPDRTDPAAEIFGDGKTWLVEASGKSDAAARKLLGRWRRDHGDGKVVEVLAAAKVEQPSEPVAWIEAAFKARSAPRGRFDPPAFRKGDIL